MVMAVKQCLCFDGHMEKNMNMRNMRAEMD